MQSSAKADYKLLLPQKLRHPQPREWDGQSGDFRLEFISEEKLLKILILHKINYMTRICEQVSTSIDAYQMLIVRIKASKPIAPNCAAGSLVIVLLHS